MLEALAAIVGQLRSGGAPVNPKRLLANIGSRPVRLAARVLVALCGPSAESRFGTMGDE